MPTVRPKTVKSRFDLAEIKRLVTLIEQSPITEFELVDGDLKIRISKNGSVPAVMHVPAAAPVSIPLTPPPTTPPTTEVVSPVPEVKAAKIAEVKAPMVGTFYVAPAPDADPYVRVGDMVEPGKVLCIVEAMKLMNEIESEFRGRVVEILVENAQPVEYGQVLMRIDTSAV